MNMSFRTKNYKSKLEKNIETNSIIFKASQRSHSNLLEFVNYASFCIFDTILK